MEIKNLTFEAKVSLYFKSCEDAKYAQKELSKNFNIGKKWEKEFNVNLSSTDSENLRSKIVELFIYSKALGGFKFSEVTIEEDYIIE